MKYKKNKKRRIYAVTGGRVGGRPSFEPPKVIKVNPDDINPIKAYENWCDIAASSYKDAHPKVSKVAKALEDKIKEGVRAAGKGNVTISFNPSEYTNGGPSKLVPAMISNSEKRIQLANAGDDRHTHKTVYETGHVPSSGLKAAMKTYGTAYRVLADSMIQARSLETRNILTGSTGFNQKNYHVPPIQSQVPVYLIKDLIGSYTGDNQEIRSSIVRLANVMNIKQQFMIKNSGGSLPMVFTIHLVKVKNSDYIPGSFNSAISVPFYGPGDDLDDFVTTEIGKVPKYLQHTLYNIEGTGEFQSIKVNTSNKLKSLNSSSSFRSAFEIVESFTKTIDAGDYWNFSHVHHCGSGIDFNSIYRSTDAGAGEESDITPSLSQDQRNMPFTYGVIFEVKGKQCEVYEIPQLNEVNTYIGSSPCYYSYEYKTSAYFAGTPTVTGNVLGPSQRVYDSESYITNFGTAVDTREKYILSENITASYLSPSTAGNVGKAYVPVQSSTINTYVKTEGGQDPG